MGKHQVIDNEILFIDDIGTFYDLDSSIDDGPIKFGAFGKSVRKHINIEKYIKLGYIEPVLYLISSFGLVVPFKIRDFNIKSEEAELSPIVTLELWNKIMREEVKFEDEDGNELSKIIIRDYEIVKDWCHFHTKKAIVC